MNQDIQAITIDEIELVNGSEHVAEPSEALAVEFPVIINNPPG